MMDHRTAARLLGGEVSGRGIVCPGLGHSPRDRSLSVLFSANAPGGFLCRSHSGDDDLAAKDYVRRVLGLSAQVALKPIVADRRQSSDRAHRSEPGRTVGALAIWNAARHPIASPVERYLGQRGLTLPNDPREVVRFSPGMAFAGARIGGMVALVRSITTNEPQAIHRTALDLAGNKVAVDGKDRLALGPIGGGAIKLTADEDVTGCLGIAEGLETALSLQLLPEFGQSPVWSLIAAGGIAAFPVLSGIECLWIAVDHDPAGERAATTCAARWQGAGKEVFLVKAKAPGADLNDLAEVRHV